MKSDERWILSEADWSRFVHIFLHGTAHNDQNRDDRKPRKVHLKQQIKIAFASNINWCELLKVCQTNQNCHQPSFFRSDLYGLPSSVVACPETNLFFFFSDKKEYKWWKKLLKKPGYKRNLIWRLKQKLKILPFPPDLAWVRWIGMINVGCRAYLELERGLQLQYFNQREKFKIFQLVWRRLKVEWRAACQADNGSCWFMGKVISAD